MTALFILDVIRQKPMKLQLAEKVPNILGKK